MTKQIYLIYAGLALVTFWAFVASNLGYSTQATAMVMAWIGVIIGMIIGQETY